MICTNLFVYSSCKSIRFYLFKLILLFCEVKCCFEFAFTMHRLFKLRALISEVVFTKSCVSQGKFLNVNYVRTEKQASLLYCLSELNSLHYSSVTKYILFKPNWYLNVMFIVKSLAVIIISFLRSLFYWKAVIPIHRYHASVYFWT